MTQKPSQAPVVEPFLHVVGDLLRRAVDRVLAARAGDALAELADGQVLAPRHRDDAVVVALAAVVLAASDRAVA